MRLSMRIDATFVDDSPMEHNVVAELPGTDPVLASQLVMLGAHFDSWHAATGATDNGAGSAVVMEAMRLLAKLADEKGKAPRRTIRAALWSGEEQGLLGSKAYVEQHFGTLQIAEGRAREALGLLQPRQRHRQDPRHLPAGQRGRARRSSAAGSSRSTTSTPQTITLNNTGGTDHLSFDALGLPGFQFIQDPISYDTQTHHSNMDDWDHAIARGPDAGGDDHGLVRLAHRAARRNAAAQADARAAPRSSRSSRNHRAGGAETIPVRAS